jgi:hypothetical protein
MSAASDKYEKDVSDNVNKIPGITATRPVGNTKFSDVKMKKDGKETWMEVKMNHTDNLSNPRVFYKNGKWQTTYKTPSGDVNPAAKYAVDVLNESPMAKKFIKDISEMAGIPLKIIKIPTTPGGLKEEGAVPLAMLLKYFNTPGMNRYIAIKENVNLGEIVTEHYTKGKAEPAYYMQAGDDFYRISNKDPFEVGSKIPLLKGYGNFKVRVSTRSESYEVQAEIKISKFEKDSEYSVKPGTKKKNPFLK